MVKFEDSDKGAMVRFTGGTYKEKKRRNTDGFGWERKTSMIMSMLSPNSKTVTKLVRK